MTRDTKPLAPRLKGKLQLLAFIKKTPKSGGTKLAAAAAGVDRSPKYREAELPTGVLLPAVHQAAGTGKGTHKCKPWLLVSHGFGADTPPGPFLFTAIFKSMKF